MRLVRGTSCFLVWVATLTVSVAKVAEVRAEQAQIAGIEKVYLRPSPGTDQTPITVLNAGDRVNILDIEGSWAKIETADGKVGYVYHRYVVPWVDGAPPPAVPRPAAPPAPPAAAAAHDRSAVASGFDSVTAFLVILFAYLVGSIPTGVLLGRVAGVDVRKQGSGNIGATNVARTAGRTLGILTLIGDALKGLAPVL